MVPDRVLLHRLLDQLLEEVDAGEVLAAVGITTLGDGLSVSRTIFRTGAGCWSAPEVLIADLPTARRITQAVEGEAISATVPDGPAG